MHTSVSRDVLRVCVTIYGTLVAAGLSREVMVSAERLSTCGGGCNIHNVLEDSIAFCAQFAWYTNVYIYIII